MARRGENIYKRKDGRYEGRYIKGRRPDGGIYFGYIYGRTYSEVKNKLNLAKTLNKENDSLRIIGNGTFVEFLRFWLESKRELVKPSTISRYHERINGHIVPVLGELLVSKINTEHVRWLIRELSGLGLASSTIAGIMRLFNSVMKSACEKRLIAQNPCEGMILPQVKEKEIQVLTKQEQIKVERFASMTGGSLEIGVFLSLYTGLRIGEACALRRRDIDLEAGTLTVRGTLQRITNLSGNGAKTMLLESMPKTTNSARVIPLPVEISNRLKCRISTMRDDCYVLTGSTVPIEPRTLRLQFQNMIRKAGLTLTYHSLRHAYATRCLEYNFDIQTLSELLGHSNAAVTMKVYAHSVLEHKKLLTGRIQVLSEINKPSLEPSSSLCSA